MLVMIKAESILERCAVDDLKGLVLQWTRPECSNKVAGCVKHPKHMQITNDNTSADHHMKDYQAPHCAFCNCVKITKRVELESLCIMKVLDQGIVRKTHTLRDGILRFCEISYGRLAGPLFDYLVMIR